MGSRALLRRAHRGDDWRALARKRGGDAGLHDAGRHVPARRPKGLTAVPSEGTINLIWQPNDEKDLAGYIVLRGVEPDKVEPITPTPIQDTTFKDTVAAGVRYSYVVKAVDTAGNASGPSNRVEETAR